MDADNAHNYFVFMLGMEGELDGVMIGFGLREEIIFADDLYCEGDGDLYDNLLSHCNMVATYNIKDILPHEDITRQAAERSKSVLKLDRD